ncbi:MAG: peroxiredoxin family protein [Armatimonadota bacterium]|nr:peroxiredoxin family protein [Armatimonadota bacterium]
MTRHGFTAIALALALAVLLVGCGDQSASRPATSARAAPEQATEDPEAAQTAPEFSLPLAGGGEVSLSDYEGKILVLDFWATNCAGCVEELPEFQEMYESWDHDKLECLGVSLDGSVGMVEAFLETRDDLTLPMAVGSPEMLEAYLGETWSIPAARVIGPEGTIAYEFGPGRSAAKVERAVAELLAEGESAEGG